MELSDPIPLAGVDADLLLRLGLTAVLDPVMLSVLALRKRKASKHGIKRTDDARKA